MKNKKKLICTVIITLVIVGLIVGGYFVLRSPWKYRGDGPIKIFYLNGYTSELSSVDDQSRGFSDYLDDKGVDYESKEFGMDFLSVTSRSDREKVADEAIRAIDEYRPDLVYATSEDAQEYVGMNYVNTDLPWVFSTVNVLGAYTGEEENVAGVLDFLDFSIYIEFMRSVLPEMRTVGLLFGETVGNEMILGEILGSESYFADVGLSFVGLDVVMTFEEFKENVLSYQGDVDFLLMGYAESFQDENGEPVTREEVVRWLVENNKIPEFSYDNSLVEEGLFSSLTSSYYGQGVASGKIAYGILIDGKAPSEIETKTVETYDKHINLARAKSLHLEVPNIVLINSEVVEKFPWEEEE